MKFERYFTKPGIPVAQQIEWKIISASIPGKKFSMPAVEVPAQWSQTATNILADKYLRKAGVPAELRVRYDTTIPFWLQPSEAIQSPARGDGECATGGETSCKQVFRRLAGAWTYTGWKHGYFDDEESAQVFYDETFWMLAMQIAAPNSPQWFNTGLWWAYGIEGPASGQWAVDYTTGKPFETENAYEYPQCHACFIQPIADDLVNPGGIMDLWTREVRLFKQGSGTGSNFSNVRGKDEPLSGGGISSGLMSFLEIGDKAAGAIQSGGVTRRAAKMVCLDLDHPEIEAFIEWKVREEQKAHAMVRGSMFAHQEWEDRGGVGLEPRVFASDWENEALRTVSGQNSNNSVRITNAFLAAVDADAEWHLRARTDGSIVKTLRARDLWARICAAAHASADPGVQFHDTINEWHTCKSDGPINASNPCGEYNFLDDTACNLASINLVATLLREDALDLTSFAHATRLWTVVLDISVSMASFPSREIALGSYNYRTLGLGYANLGGLLMRLGLPYDTDEGRNLAAALTALMHGEAYATSASMAHNLGPFPRWGQNTKNMRRVMHKHAQAVQVLEGVGVAESVAVRAKAAWNSLESTDGFRNAQVTLLAPTGTISFVMDCDTTGVEPDLALRKHKYLAGGGEMDIINAGVGDALTRLGYNDLDREGILRYVDKFGTVEGCRLISAKHLPVFDCANAPEGFARSIAPLAHVRMVAAVQPFLSGAVSKTINMPAAATVADVDAVYREAHRLGLKAVAIYRDGSKSTQPLSTAKTVDESERMVPRPQEASQLPPSHAVSLADTALRGVETDRIARGGREALLPRRGGYTQKFKVDGQSAYLRTGEYEDGRLGEIFVELSKQGSTMRAVMNSLAIAVSIGLQHGVPLARFVESFVHTRFEPAGAVQGHDRIKMCSSLVDLIFRDLGLTYLGREDLAHIAAPVAAQAVAEIHEVIAPLLEEYRTPTAIVASGSLCSICGVPMQRAGACLTCPQCGNTSGCG